MKSVLFLDKYYRAVCPHCGGDHFSPLQHSLQISRADGTIFRTDEGKYCNSCELFVPDEKIKYQHDLARMRQDIKKLQRGIERVKRNGWNRRK